MSALDRTDSNRVTPAGSSRFRTGDAAVSSTRNVRAPRAGTTPARRGPTRGDVVFRLAASTFCIWVVLVVATSPVSHQRPGWWPWVVGLGVVLSGAMLAGAFMTLSSYLRERY